VPANVNARIHETAIVEDDVSLGDGTTVWHHAHIRGPASVGAQCIVGGKSYIAYGVCVGNRVKINNNVYLCNAVTIEDGVMISAGTTFTNDRFPRACDPTLQDLLGSEPDESTLPTLVKEGATVGAGCVIGCDLSIGRFAMIGMGSLVTKSIPDFALAFGSPARVVGFVDRRGRPWLKFEPGTTPADQAHRCSDGFNYQLRSGVVTQC